MKLKDLFIKTSKTHDWAVFITRHFNWIANKKSMQLSSKQKTAKFETKENFW